MDWQPLDFEKPIFELERRLQDLKNHSDAHDVDLDSAVKTVEEKLRETRREIYDNLTAWHRAAHAAAVRDGLHRTVLYKLD
jgi:acetyl-CoA carboxylase carboxyl transferase subunit alpha